MFANVGNYFCTTFLACSRF